MKRPAIKRFFTSGLILLMAAMLGGFGKPERLQVGDTIPEVTVTDLQGKTLNLPQDIKGKVALVRFWMFECTHCNKDMLFSLESLYQKYRNEGFIPLALHVTRPPVEDGRFRKLERLTYPMLIDEFRTVAIKFGVIGLPTTFIVDEQGIVREKIVGETEIDMLEKLLTTVLYKGGSYDSAY